MADIAAVMQFFGALYLGTPFVGTYGESSLAALERRRAHCIDALGSEAAAEALPEYTPLQNALDDFRIAIDAPISRGKVRRSFLFAAAHVAIGLLCASVAEVKVLTVFALPVLLSVGILFVIVGGSGVYAVVKREQSAASATRELELALRRLHQSGRGPQSQA